MSTDTPNLQAQILQWVKVAPQSMRIKFLVAGQTSFIRLRELVWATAQPGFEQHVQCVMGFRPVIDAERIDCWLYLLSELCSLRGVGNWTHQIVETEVGPRALVLADETFD